MKVFSTITPKMGLILAVAVMGISVHAATFSTSTSAPTPDADDIYMLSQTDADWNTSVIWGDRPARGQTFTTGTHASGYTFDVITVKSAMTQTGDGTYYIRVGTISGTAFTPVVSESVYTTDNVAVDDYVSFTLDSPISLTASTLYGFDIGRSGNGWYSYRNTDNTSYSGGSAYSSGGSGVGGATISTYTHDRVFHLNVNEVGVPEPSTAILAVLGLMGFCFRCRK